MCLDNDDNDDDNLPFVSFFITRQPVVLDDRPKASCLGTSVALVQRAYLSWSVLASQRGLDVRLCLRHQKNHTRVGYVYNSWVEHGSGTVTQQGWTTAKTTMDGQRSVGFAPHLLAWLFRGERLDAQESARACVWM